MKNKIFKIFTGIAGIYHILLGVAALIFPVDTMVKVIDTILGFAPVVDDQFQLIAKFAGVYVLVFGITLLILAKNPVKHRVLAFPVLALFGIRLINKLVFFSSIATLYSVPTSRGVFAVLSIVVFFFVILFTMPKKQS